MKSKSKSQILIMLGALLIIFPMIIQPPQMQIVDTPIFSSGFETGDLSDFDGVVTTTNETAIVTNSIPHSGAYSLEIKADGLANNEEAYVYKTFPTDYDIISASMYVRYGLANPWWKIIMRFEDTSSNIIVHAYASATGYRIWYRVGQSFTYSDSAYLSSTGTWYKIELTIVVSSTTGEYILSIDGNPIITVTGVDSSAFGNVGNVKFGLVQYPNDLLNEPLELWVDDVAINGGQSETPPTQPTTYNLLVNTNPIMTVSYTVDSQTATTGTSITLDSGTYLVTMPSSVQESGIYYTFGYWEDSSTNPQRQISLTSDLTLIATYVEQTPPTSGNGYLEIHTYEDSTEINAQGIILETNYSFSTTTAGVTIELPEGTYTVQTSYKNQTLSKSGVVTSGSTTRLDFQFTLSTITTSTNQTTPVTSTTPREISTVLEAIPTPLLIQLSGVALVVVGTIRLRRKER